MNTSKSMQKGNISKMIPALIGMDASDLNNRIFCKKLRLLNIFQHRT